MLRGYHCCAAAASCVCSLPFVGFSSRFPSLASRPSLAAHRVFLHGLYLRTRKRRALSLPSAVCLIPLHRSNLRVLYTYKTYVYAPRRPSLAVLFYSFLPLLSCPPPPPPVPCASSFSSSSAALAFGRTTRDQALDRLASGYPNVQL